MKSDQIIHNIDRDDRRKMMMDKNAAIDMALMVIGYFYPTDTPLRRMLLKHSEQVREKALAILANPAIGLDIDGTKVAAGAMLHDIGILSCRAPKIWCMGNEPYIAHGVIGAKMLRDYGAAHGMDLEDYARICERHTGSGITAEEVRAQGLPIPERDYLPETMEEKLICLADKFFSKSGDMKEKSITQVRHSMENFGAASLARFEQLYQLFIVSSR